MSAEGYKLDSSTTELVKNLKKTPPRIIGEVRKLVGLLSYYRRYIKDFLRLPSHCTTFYAQKPMMMVPPQENQMTRVETGDQ